MTLDFYNQKNTIKDKLTEYKKLYKEIFTW